MAMKLDPNLLESQAEDVEMLASNMGKEAGLSLERIADNIKAGWTGDAAKTYSKFMDGAAETIHKYTNTMREHATAMRNIAKTVRAADEAAKRQASQ